MMLFSDDPLWRQTALTRLWEAIVEHEADAAVRPHVVVYHNPVTGREELTGPFENPVDAFAAICAMEDADRQAEPAGTYSVAVLMPWG